MAGNIFGKIFRVVTFGESHGPALGCVIDGCPAGLSLSLDDIERELSRRRPGGSGPAASPRDEQDRAEILSGLYEGRTLGTPIALVIRNTSQHSGDYGNLKDSYRPGHADWTWEAKYGFRDYRGGGRSSGRETAGRVAAGAAAKAFLAANGLRIQAWVSQAAGIAAPDPAGEGFDLEEAERNPLRVPGKEALLKISARLEELKAAGDSAGGVISCAVTGAAAGLGEPVFDKLPARLGAAVLSIGGCKGIEFGAGFAAAALTGSENNDPPLPAEQSPADGAGPRRALPPGVPDLSFKTNNAGGTLGGISNGMPLNFRAAFKPVSSIGKKQETPNRDGTIGELIVTGRHDVCILPRAVPVVEAMTALVLADLILEQRAAVV
jgi:chorismate synthase